jgi:hypothetical protein
MGVPAFYFRGTVKDQRIRLTIEASGKIQGRSRELVHESSILIATAIALVDDSRLASARRKPENLAARLGGVSWVPDSPEIQDQKKWPIPLRKKMGLNALVRRLALQTILKAPCDFHNSS